MSKENGVAFADEKLSKAFNRLQSGSFEEKELYRFVDRALEDLKRDPLCGVRVPNRLIPRGYTRKYLVDNLRKYNLPNGWRLLYSIQTVEFVTMSVVLEWLSHPDYEKRFGYKNK